MSFKGYKLKFKLHAAHSNMAGDLRNIHYHTFTLALYLKNVNEETDFFMGLEKEIEEWLAPYQNKELPRTDLFFGKSTSLESIGDVFFEDWKERVAKINYDLVRLDIYENPVRTYSVSDRLLDGEVNEISAMPFYSSSTMEFGKAEEETVYREEVAASLLSPEETASEQNPIAENCEIEAVVKGQEDDADEKRIGIKKLCIFLVSAFVGFALISFGIWLTLKISGTFPQGEDTLGYLYRGDLLLQNIKKGIFYPLYDKMWYNGVEFMRYNAPVPLYILSALQQIGGSIFDGYYLLLATVFFVGAVGWLILGVKLNRVGLGFFFGILWFFMPENMRIMMVAGDIPGIMVHALLPYMLLSVWTVVADSRRYHGPGVSVLFALAGLCKFEFTMLLLVAVAVFLCFYGIANHRKKEIGIVLVSALAGIMAIGLWLVPYLGGLGGAEAENASRIIADTFEKAAGIAVLLVALFGLLLGTKKTYPGFLTGSLLYLCTTESAYLLFEKLPVGRFSQMSRCVMISMAFVFFSVLLWKGLKRAVVLAICGLFVLGCIPSVRYVYSIREDGGTVMTVQQEKRAASLLLDNAKSITTHRLAVFDLGTYGTFVPYYISGVEEKVPYTFGVNQEGAKTANNIAMLNKAVEDGRYAYVFDRSLELGNDTLLFNINVLKNKSKDAESLIEQGLRFGYELVEQNKDMMLFHKETEREFGVITYYENIAIGRSAKEIALLYPSFAEGSSNNISDYTVEDLIGYKRIFLSGFSYNEKEDAEQMLTELANSGVKIYIDMNRIQENPKTYLPEFFGVEAQTITFQDRFPALEYQGEYYDTGEFSEELKGWKTCYMTGLSEVTGVGRLNSRALAFAGTNGHENIVFLGYNIAYYAQESNDRAGVQLLSQLMEVSTEALPERRIVPMDVVYSRNRITITSEYDNINTTLAKLDIFESTGFRTARNLVVVDRGITEITMKYPYFTEGATVTALGLLLGVFWHMYLCIHKKKQRKRRGE